MGHTDIKDQDLLTVHSPYLCKENEPVHYLLSSSVKSSKAHLLRKQMNTESQTYFHVQVKFKLNLNSRTRLIYP